ncbi:hypothetical protein [Streptomyces sp. MNP-20]|uniref:hypothetical protein n=1 Tax=Streptomyces sp. MNP-20 TaxID=2721165 RepID=UPI0015555755|nr:hypothetical protein [Streptomyces sp. MNP-20]
MLYESLTWGFAGQADGLRIADVAVREADPQAAADAYAFTAFQVAQQAVQEYQGTALVVLGRAGEADAEARRAYETEQGRRWFQHNPNGAGAVVAATRAADTARQYAAKCMLATRLEQLSELAPRTAGAVTAWSS